MEDEANTEPERVHWAAIDSDGPAPVQTTLTTPNGRHLRATPVTQEQWTLPWPLSDGSNGDGTDHLLSENERDSSDGEQLFEASPHQQPLLQHFPMESDGSLPGYNRTTALHGARRRRWRSDTHKGRVQRLAERWSRSTSV